MIKYNTNNLRLIFTTLFIIGILSSCIKEDFSDCLRPFQLFIKAMDVDNTDITESGAVQSLILFVFDENDKLIDEIELTANQIKSRVPIEIYYPGKTSLRFVAWANIDSNVDFLNVNQTSERSLMTVKLKSEDGIAQSPCDLFAGNLITSVEIGGYEHSASKTLEINRKTTSVIITAKKLESWSNSGVSSQARTSDSFHFMLHESPDTYSENGVLSGNMVSYKPTVSFDANRNLVTPVFLSYPTLDGKSYTLEIYKNQTLIYSATHGSDGKPFTPVVGKLLNIIVDFGGTLDVKVVVTPWGVIHQDVEY